MATPIATSNIVAQAFRLMELRAFSSLADDSPQAVAAAQQYPEAINLVLEAYDWSFARKLVTLAPTLTLPDDTVADPDLAGLFTLPADYLTLRRVYPDDLAFRVDQGVLRAAQTTALTILYTAHQDNEDRMPAAFKLAVALQLAVLLAPEWVAARTKRLALQDELKLAVAAARRADGATASHRRLDGRAAVGDWASEAIV